MLNNIMLYGREKERGRGSYKRKWVIEMNEARQLYLATYGTIDTLDSRIKQCNVWYKLWKYWHAAKNHGYALAVSIAYGIYVECAKLDLCLELLGYKQRTNQTTNQTTIISPPVIKSFIEFKEILSQQGLEYDPSNLRYPGDKHMRKNTARSKKRRVPDSPASKRKVGRPKKGEERPDTTPMKIITPEQYKEATRFAKKSWVGASRRRQK